jgi:flagellar hook-length control protein FliK
MTTPLMDNVTSAIKKPLPDTRANYSSESHTQEFVDSFKHQLAQATEKWSSSQTRAVEKPDHKPGQKPDRTKPTSDNAEDPASSVDDPSITPQLVAQVQPPPLEQPVMDHKAEMEAPVVVPLVDVPVVASMPPDVFTGLTPTNMPFIPLPTANLAMPVDNPVRFNNSLPTVGVAPVLSSYQAGPVKPDGLPVNGLPFSTVAVSDQAPLVTPLLTLPLPPNQQPILLPSQALNSPPEPAALPSVSSSFTMPVTVTAPPLGDNPQALPQATVTMTPLTPQNVIPANVAVTAPLTVDNAIAETPQPLVAVNLPTADETNTPPVNPLPPVTNGSAGVAAPPQNSPQNLYLAAQQSAKAQPADTDAALQPVNDDLAELDDTVIATVDTTERPVVHTSVMGAASNGPTGSPQPVTQQVNQQLQHMLTPANSVANAPADAASGRREITFQLNPETLGQVRVQLTNVGPQQVASRLIVDSPEALQQLQQDVHHLKAALARQGVTLDSVTVVMAGGDAAKPQTDSQQNPSSSQQDATFQAFGQPNLSSQQRQSQSFQSFAQFTQVASKTSHSSIPSGWGSVPSTSNEPLPTNELGQHNVWV